ncbi:MAG: ATP-grasp domain-containing protein [Acidimicrobiales bacterium]
MPTRLWVNATFGAVHHAIRLLRENPDGERYEVFGTHTNGASAMLAACDHAGLEPEVVGDAYADWAIDYCRRNAIDVLLPTRELLTLARRAGDFRDAGTVLLAADASVVEVLSSKTTMYDSAARLGVPVPRCSAVSTADEFVAAVAALHAAGLVACVKPAAGNGAEGFRILTTRPAGIRSVYEGPSRTITVDAMEAILRTVPGFEPLIVSEYLRGPEFSIDCLGDGRSLILAVARGKAAGGARRIVDRPDLMDQARRIAEGYGLRSLFNVQIRGEEGTAKLVEVNPRASAGMHQSGLAGANFLHAAIQLELTGRTVFPPPTTGVLLANLSATVYQAELSRSEPRPVANA